MTELRDVKVFIFQSIINQNMSNVLKKINDGLKKNQSKKRY